MQEDAAPEESGLQHRQHKSVLFPSLKIEIIAKAKKPSDIKSNKSGTLRHIDGGGLGPLSGMIDQAYQEINLVEHGRFE